MQNLKPSDLNTKKTAIVSACLLGEYCRYDGKTKQDLHVKEFLKDYEIIPFCPEAPVFGTPRERIDVVEIDGEKRIFTHESHIDVTNKLKQEITRFLSLAPTPDLCILKSKSPSCGLGTTPFYNEKKELVGYTDGLGASMLKEHFQDVRFSDEVKLSVDQER